MASDNQQPQLITDIRDPTGVLMEVVPSMLDSQRNAPHIAELMSLNMYLEPDVSPMEHYSNATKNIALNGPDIPLAQAAARVNDQMMTEQFGSLLKSSVTMNQEQLAQAVADFKDASDLSNNIVLPRVSAIVAANAGASAGDQLKRHEESKQLAFMMLQEKRDEMGYGESTLNFASDALFPFYTQDRKQLVNTGFFDTREKWLKFVNAYQSLDPVEQMVYMQEGLFDKLWEDFDGNQFAVQGALEDLYSADPAADFTIGQVFDILSVADVPAVLTAGKALLKKGVLSTTSRPALLNELGNVELAAAENAILASGRVETLNTASRTTADEALTSVQPFSSIVDPNLRAVQGLSPDTIRIFENSNITSDVIKNAAKAKNVDIMKKSSWYARQLAEDLASGAKESRRARLAANASDPMRTAYEVKLADDIARLRRGQIPAIYRPVIYNQVAKDFTAIKESVDAAIRAAGQTPRPNNAIMTPTSVTQRSAARAQVHATFAEKAAKAGLNQATIEDAERLKEATINVGNIADVDPVDPTALKDLINATKAKIEEEARDAGKLITSIEVSGVSKNGFTATIIREDGTFTQDVPFTLDGLGAWSYADTKQGFRVQNYLNLLLSKENLLAPIDGLVDDVTFLSGQSAKIRNELIKRYAEATQGLTRAERDLVNELLVASDKGEVFFSLADFQDGVYIGTKRTQVSAAVAKGYYRTAAVMEGMWEIANSVFRNRLKLRGGKNLSRPGLNGDIEEHVIFPVGKGTSVKDERILVSDQQSFIGGHNWKTYKERDYELYELLSPLYDKNKKAVRYVAVKRSDGVSNISELPARVLNKSNGVYIPRHYKRGYYYIRDMGNPRAPVIAVARTNKYAEDYIARYTAQGGTGNLKAWADKEFRADEVIVREAGNWGGMYFGSRSSRPLMVDTAGEVKDLERLHASDSIQRYIDAISRIRPYDEYRMIQMERFKKTVEAIAKREGTGGFKDGDVMGEIFLPPIYKQQMEMAREYMVKTLAIPDHKEGRFYALMGGLADVADGKGWEGAKAFALNMQDANLGRALKSAAFSAQLGWFNLRHLFVQAQNAFIATMIDPIHAPKALLKAPALVAGMATDANNLERLNELGKLFGIKDYAQQVRDFRRSGMYDSIRNVADLEMNKMGIGNMHMEKFRKVNQAGLIFYEYGELYSRLVGWEIAKSRLFKGKKVAGFSDKEIKAITDETFRININMQNTNAAWWQEHAITSILFQYAQISAKFLERVAPVALGGSGKWTGMEKARVFGGQLALYGIVGVPFVEDWANGMFQATGTDPEEFMKANPRTYEGLQRGMLGVAAQALDIDVDFSSAGSILKGLDENALVALTDTLFSAIAGGESTLKARDIMGPSWTVVTRGGDAAITLVRGIEMMFYIPSFETLAVTSMDTLDAAAKIASSWNNLRKARLLNRADGILSSKGNVIINKAEQQINFRTAFARSLGFQSLEEAEYFAGVEWNMSQQEKFNRALVELKDNFRDYMGHDNKQLYEMRASMILDELDPMDRIKAMKSVAKDMLSTRSAKTEQSIEFLNEKLRSGKAPGFKETMVE